MKQEIRFPGFSSPRPLAPSTTLLLPLNLGWFFPMWQACRSASGGSCPPQESSLAFDLSAHSGSCFPARRTELTARRRRGSSTGSLVPRVQLATLDRPAGPWLVGSENTRQPSATATLCPRRWRSIGWIQGMRSHGMMLQWWSLAATGGCADPLRRGILDCASPS